MGPQSQSSSNQACSSFVEVGRSCSRLASRTIGSRSFLFLTGGDASGEVRAISGREVCRRGDGRLGEEELKEEEELASRKGSKSSEGKVGKERECGSVLRRP